MAVSGVARPTRYPIEWVLPVLFVVSLFTFYPVAYTLWPAPD